MKCKGPKGSPPEIGLVKQNLIEDLNTHTEGEGDGDEEEEEGEGGQDVGAQPCIVSFT